ncbi:MAG: FAD-dependent oxidoreductase, partial [Intestinibacter sp.]
MKIIIIGGVAGGATTATRLRRLNENAQIIMIERGKHISFANCGLPYYIGDVIQEKQDLLLQTPESFKKRFAVDVRVCQEVIQINRKEKKLVIRKLQNQENSEKDLKEDSKENLKKNSEEIYEETYDKLVIATGAEPINPYKNVVTDQIKTLRSVEDAVEIKKMIKERNLRHVTIIGGGYIG